MNRIECPYCKEVIEDDGSPYDAGDWDEECPHCEKKFKLTVEHETNYYTSASCRLNGEIPHVLVGNDAHHYICKKCKNDFYDWMFPGGKYPNLKPEDFVIDTQTTLPLRVRE